MSVRVVKLTDATIAHGRIYFSSADVNFFPADSFADRAKAGIKGRPVRFEASSFETECDVRVLSSKRLSPRSSFASYLRSVGAKPGSTLRVERVSDRLYRVSHHASGA